MPRTTQTRCSTYSHPARTLSRRSSSRPMSHRSSRTSKPAPLPRSSAFIRDEIIQDPARLHLSDASRRATEYSGVSQTVTAHDREAQTAERRSPQDRRRRLSRRSRRSENKTMKTTWPVRISEDGSYALRDIVTTYGWMYEVVDANKIETKQPTLLSKARCEHQWGPMTKCLSLIHFSNDIECVHHVCSRSSVREPG